MEETHFNKNQPTQLVTASKNFASPQVENHHVPKTYSLNYYAVYYHLMTFSFNHFTLILPALAVTLNIPTKLKMKC